MPSSPLMNPAAMNYQSLSFYIEAAHRFSTKWYGFDYDGQTIVPSFGSIGFSSGTTSLAFGYANTFDLNYSSSIIVTTPEYPEGTGETFDYKRSVKTHSFFGSLGFPAGDKISVGMSVGVNYMTLHDEIFKASADGNGIGMLIVGGVTFNVSEHLSLGGAFRYASPALASLSYFEVPALPPDSGRQFFQIESFQYRLQHPWTIDLGVSWGVSQHANIMFSAEYEHWSHINSYRNLLQCHVGIAVAISDEVDVQAGFFTQDSPIQPFGSFAENFLTAGISWKTSDRVLFSLNVLDSHLVSNSSGVVFGPVDENFRQASVSLGIGYALPAE